MSHTHDMVQRYCAVCGRPAGSRHHEPPKGLGGVGTKGIEPPRVSLCGTGNTGCHGLRHAGRLELRYESGWEWRGESAAGIRANRWTKCRSDGFWAEIGL